MAVTVTCVWRLTCLQKLQFLVFLCRHHFSTPEVPTWLALSKHNVITFPSVFLLLFEKESFSDCFLSLYISTCFSCRVHQILETSKNPGAFPFYRYKQFFFSLLSLVLRMKVNVCIFHKIPRGTWLNAFSKSTLHIPSSGSFPTSEVKFCVLQACFANWIRTCTSECHPIH